MATTKITGLGWFGIIAGSIAGIWVVGSLITGKWNPLKWFSSSAPETGTNTNANNPSGVNREVHQCPAGQHYENGACVPDSNINLFEKEAREQLTIKRRNSTSVPPAERIACWSTYSQSSGFGGLTVSGACCTDGVNVACSGARTTEQVIINPRPIISPAPTGGRPSTGVGVGVGATPSIG